MLAGPRLLPGVGELPAHDLNGHERACTAQDVLGQHHLRAARHTRVGYE